MAMSCSRVRMSMSAATRSMCRFAAATGKKKLAVTELLDLRQREMMRIAITVVSKPSQGSFQEIENVQDCKDRLRPRYWDGLLLASGVRRGDRGKDAPQVQRRSGHGLRTGGDNGGAGRG